MRRAAAVVVVIGTMLTFAGGIAFGAIKPLHVSKPIKGDACFRHVPKRGKRYYNCRPVTIGVPTKVSSSSQGPSATTTIPARTSSSSPIGTTTATLPKTTTTYAPPTATTTPPATTTTTYAPPTTTTTTTTTRGPFSPVPSSQWAGYIETPGAVTGASGTWVVPSLSCSGGEALSSTWIGVGGFDGSVLLQAGLYDNCIGGVAENGAFAEAYPGNEVNFGLLTRPGDSVTASVTEVNGSWEASVTDNTTGQTQSAPVSGYGGGGAAEWIVEAYGSPGGIPLPNFGSEQVTNFVVNGAGASIPESGAWEIAGAAVPSDPASGQYKVAYQ